MLCFWVSTNWRLHGEICFQQIKNSKSLVSQTSEMDQRIIDKNSYATGGDSLREITRQDFWNNLWKVVRMKGFGPVCTTFDQYVVHSVSLGFKEKLFDILF